jgi:hypothetical protein
MWIENRRDLSITCTASYRELLRANGRNVNPPGPVRHRESNGGTRKQIRFALEPSVNLKLCVQKFVEIYGTRDGVMVQVCKVQMTTIPKVLFFELVCLYRLMHRIISNLGPKQLYPDIA